MDIIGKLAVGIIVICFSLYVTYFQKGPDNKFDLIIVGTGLAGLTSAIEANRLSAGKLKILLIEKEGSFGGNSMKATSGINLLSTPAQRRNNINDSCELFFQDTMKSSNNISDPVLVKILVENSKHIYQFFSQFNVTLSQVAILGGHSRARTHRPLGAPIGIALTSALMNYIYHNTNIQVRLNASAFELIANKKKGIQGIKYIDRKSKYIFSIYSHAIILATGGFAHDFDSKNSLIKEFAPNLLGFPTTNGPQAEGLGLKMARRIGAKLIDMQYIQLHPTGFVDQADRFSKKKILAPELIRGVGGILLNQQGNRFCNELGPRDDVSSKILDNCMKFQGQTESIVVVSEKGIIEYGNNIKFYVNKGLIKEFENWEKLCNYYSLPIENVMKTLESYDQAIAVGRDNFGKTVFPCQFSFKAKVYGGVITPSIHYTMGGVKINRKTQILKEDGLPIQGLFGAGEVTGGVHGANRLGANSLLECAVFGRLAARNAYAYILQGYIKEAF